VPTLTENIIALKPTIIENEPTHTENNLQTSVGNHQ
jgi:hypothetical protein